jgi:hypothetical protein
MDWWELHDAILNGKMRRLSWTDDEGQRSVIVGRKWGVSRGSFLPYSYKRAHAQGCKLYAYLVSNVKGVVEGLEDLPVVREFVDVIPRRITRCAA